MNQHEPIPDNTLTTNPISADYPAGKSQVHAQSNAPKSTRLTQKNDYELESVAYRSIN